MDKTFDTCGHWLLGCAVCRHINLNKNDIKRVNFIHGRLLPRISLEHNILKRNDAGRVTYGAPTIRGSKRVLAKPRASFKRAFE